MPKEASGTGVRSRGGSVVLENLGGGAVGKGLGGKHYTEMAAEIKTLEHRALIIISDYLCKNPDTMNFTQDPLQSKVRVSLSVCVLWQVCV